jgi:hypothetical protein
MPFRASLARERRPAPGRRSSARAAAAVTACVIAAATSAAAATARTPAPDDGIFFRVVAASGGYEATADTTWRWTGEDFDCHAQATSSGSWQWTGHRRDGIDLDLTGREWRRLELIMRGRAASSGTNDCGRRPVNGGAVRETFQCRHPIAVHREHGGAGRLTGHRLKIGWDFTAVDARVDPCRVGGEERYGLGDATTWDYSTNRMVTAVPLAHPLTNAPVVVTVRRPIHDVSETAPVPGEYASYRVDVEGQGSLTVTLVRGDLGGGAVSICGSAFGTVSKPGRPPAARGSSAQHCSLANHQKLKLPPFANCQDFDAYRHGNPYLGETDWHLYGAYSFKERLIGYSVTLKWTLPPGLQTITVPDISWPNMTPDEQQRLRAAMEALNAHEHGHLAVGQRFVDALPEEHFYVLRFRSIQDRIDGRRKKLEAELQAEQDRYDAVTHHGATQVLGPRHGLPGGANIAFSCPPPA